MSYDPHREDYQRLGLRFARSLDGKDPAAATRAFASFGRRFSQNRDSLPQSDADRAFHLVAEATTLIDYELPFANDAQAEELIERGHRLLDEALALDSHCHDALRMKQAAESTSFESYYDFLASSADDVRAACEEARAQAHDESPERALLEADIAMRPYYRWLATQAGKAVICGHLHGDYYGWIPNTSQLLIREAAGCIGISTPYSTVNSAKDLGQIYGTKTEDCFNFYAIKPASHTIGIVRFGADTTYEFTKRDYMVQDYTDVPQA